MSEIVEVLQKTPPRLRIRCACGRVYVTTQAYVSAKRRTNCIACRKVRR